MHPRKRARNLVGPIASLLLVVATAAGGALVKAQTASAIPPPPPSTPWNQCPPVGLDTSCAVLIVINPDGTVTAYNDLSQPAFDGIEDTLVGVQNNFAAAVTSMPLQGPNIFGFDGDGLCSQGVRPSGCPFGPTRYEGKDTSFTNYNLATGCSTCTGSTGTVLFTGGIQPGRSAYFSLEERVVASNLVLDLPIRPSGTTFSATEGVLSTGTVATFTDPDSTAVAADYSAMIAWGDSTPNSPGVITGTPSQFTVTGTHRYAEEGSSTITVTITDVDNSGNGATVQSSAKIADAQLHARCAMPPFVSLTYTGPTATFTDDATTGMTSDFSATISWGDGSSAGTVTGPGGNGPYTVTGSHTYSSTGVFTVTTTINDDGGSKATADCSVAVFAFPTGNGATFVIGDLEATLGNHVTWWGSQWENLNPMSGGPGPDSMKGFAGFEDNLMGLPPACGGSWTTDPGNSTPPPPSVPNVMAVIVSSKITKTGSTITGNIPAIAIVKNDPGYAPSPGNPGTGTVLGVICLP